MGSTGLDGLYASHVPGKTMNFTKRTPMVGPLMAMVISYLRWLIPFWLAPQPRIEERPVEHPAVASAGSLLLGQGAGRASGDPEAPGLGLAGCCWNAIH